MHSIEKVLSAMVANDFGDDLARAVTFPGGYLPTSRVMLQRHWSRELSKVVRIAGLVRSDAWVEMSIGVVHVGFRDNREKASHAADISRLAISLRAAGFTARITSAGIRVTTSRESDLRVEAAAPRYIDRIQRAIESAG